MTHHEISLGISGMEYRMSSRILLILHCRKLSILVHFPHMHSNISPTNVPIPYHNKIPANPQLQIHTNPVTNKVINIVVSIIENE